LIDETLIDIDDQYCKFPAIWGKSHTCQFFR